MCSKTGTGVCGSTYGACSPGIPQIVDATHWKCLGSFSSQTWDDTPCDLDSVDGNCGEIHGSCTEGTEEIIVADSSHWWCRGKN